MPSKSPVLPLSSASEIRALGERLRMARLRRTLSAESVAAQAGISRPTLSKIERGDGSVTLGSYTRVLGVLGLEQDLRRLASEDMAGRHLQDARLPARGVRAPCENPPKGSTAHGEAGEDLKSPKD